MSRIANYPVAVPSGVQVAQSGAKISVKGPKGSLEHEIHPLVKVTQEGTLLKFKRTNDSALARAVSGTTRALVNNMVTGVAKGFEKKLTIIGVGYRAAVQGKKLNLTLGYSHPIVYDIPNGISIEAPDLTNLVIKGADKQLVGQVAAEIRGYRSPEPYKGKGVRYVDETVVKKEAKKK
ncbi:MAG TPA: 50S ribosomal protein L6 [Sulfuricaulis sp.]|jgi:large subunit ribosomal protein L6|uniref:Large ribosomal subunit protein uL6 n=1 Tax=uncultured proteobacterium Rifle_16ft_4_minimus_11209 TaxID=1665205 RepID=A0A0H4T2A6_9PROT|nr:50S ribosomal protein L6, large subunit ribosomal protein L6 [uncultured proteobacterium Rifle_16ft_4_minimus_11209]HLE93986.1 50S ribosomal protein L6 [Sulfuricaulis sp.]